MAEDAQLTILFADVCRSTQIFEQYGDVKQMAHPDYIVSEEARATLPTLEPVYPLTAGLSGKVLLKALRQALLLVPELPEWQDVEGRILH